jgi:hypothetical protein
MIRWLVPIVIACCFLNGCATSAQNHTISREDVARMSDAQVMNEWYIARATFREERLLEEAITTRKILTFDEYRQVIAGEITLGQRREVARLAAAQYRNSSGAVRVLNGEDASWLWTPVHGRVWFENGKVVSFTN